MRSVQLKQGSEAWKLYRMEHANASEAGALMGVAPSWMQIHTPYQLWQYKQGDIEFEGSEFLERAQEHGHKTEPLARAWLSDHCGIPFSPEVFEEEIRGRDYSASLDGYGKSFDEKFSHKAEIKCPATGEKSETWKSALNGEIQPHLYWQVVHQEMVCPTDKTYFCVYLDADRVINLDLDEVMPGWKNDVERLLEAWDAFYTTPPEPDWEDRDDAPWLVAEKEYVRLKKLADQTAADLKTAKAVLVGLTNTKRVRGEKIELSHQTKRGSIQYAKIPDIKDMDLEQYRGKSSATWVVRIRK